MKIFKSVDSNWKQYLYTFILLQLLFILSTFWHEMGHYIPAKLLGYSPTFQYSAVHYDDKTTSLNRIDSIYSIYNYEIINDIDFPGRKEYNKLRSDLINQPFYITLLGPVLTLLTGLFASFYLYYRRWKRRGTDWHFLDYLLVMISLNFSRNSYFLFLFLLRYIKGKKYLAGFSDETNIAFFLNINANYIIISLGLFAGLFLFINFFLMVPVKQRYQFLLTCLLSWIFGNFFWMNNIFELLKTI